MPPKLRSIALISFLLCPYFAVIAQSNQPGIVSGIVTDETNNSPIPAASVRIDKTSNGTITNAEGRFVINVAASNTETMFTISCIGYESAHFKLSSKQTGNPIKVILKRSDKRLKEVVISTESAAQIVAHAYRNIPKNYASTNTLYTGFYRETNLQTNADSIERYRYLIEAVISMNKPSYQKTNPEGDIKVEQSRKREFAGGDSLVRWYAGAYTPIRFDVAKKRFDFIDPDHQKRYNYVKEDVTTYYDEPVYVISFAPRSNADYAGTLYIDTHSYAIVKADYQLTKSGLNSIAIFHPVKISNRKFKVNYQPIDHKWYLQSVWQQAIGKETISHRKVRYVTEYTTTHIDTGKTKDFNYGEKLQFDEVLSAKAIPFDEGFWNNYNIVAQTRDLKELLVDTTVAAAKQPTMKADTTRSKNHIQPQYQSRPSSGLIRFRPVYRFPVIGIIQSMAGDALMQYHDANGASVVNQAFRSKRTNITGSFALGFELDLFKNGGIAYNQYDSYGGLNTSEFNLGLQYHIN